MARKHETNVQIVKRMMEFSRNGALAQIFIMDAIEKCARAVANTDPAKLREMMGEDGLIDPRSWQDTAREICDNLDARR